MGLNILGLFLIIYAMIVFFITMKKPTKIWNMGKIRFFVKVLGEKGTIIFFYIWGLIALVVGIWLMTK